MPKNRNSQKVRARARTAKLLDRITYSPVKHKQKETRKRLAALQGKKQLPVPKPQDAVPTLKFGSFNINGMDLETGWAVGELLRTRGFDVSTINV